MRLIIKSHRQTMKSRERKYSIESEHFWKPTISFHLFATDTYTQKTFKFLLIRHCISGNHYKLLFSFWFDSSFYWFFFTFYRVNNVFLFRVSCTIFVHITNKITRKIREVKKKIIKIVTNRSEQVASSGIYTDKVHRVDALVFVMCMIIFHFDSRRSF